MKPPFRSSHIPTRVLLATLFFLLAAALETVQAQSVTLSATSVSFGSVGVGSTSAARNVTLRNTSTTTALSITSIVPSGNFAQTNTCGTSVAAGGRCVITVTFTPAALGASTGTVVITDNSTTGTTQTITLTGTGVAPIALTPTSHNFGSVGEGTTSAASTFTVRNYTTAAVPLTISTAGPFAETTTTCTPTSVAANSSCTISVTFNPTVAGAQTGSLSVTPTGVGSPQTATLTGSGVTPITITPASRAFGSVVQGTTSAATTFTVRNNTTAVQSSMSFSSSNPEFAYTGCATPLAAGASCTLSVTFAPTATATGLQTGSIAVAYTGTGSPQSVTVTGTAVTPLTVSPTSIAFSTVRAVGTPSQPHSVTITNRATSAVAIGSIAASPAAYAITANTCTSSLAAAASCTVTVVFTPTVVNTTTGTLTIPYGTAGQIVVPMTGGAQVNNLVSLAITPNASSIAAGISEQLTATGTYGSGATGNVTSVAVWSSSNQGIATVVSNTGVVKGVAAGTATITATVTATNNGTVTNTANVIVTPKTLTSITLASTSGGTTQIAPPTLAAGTTLQVYATGTYNDGSTGDITTQATWNSSTSNAAVTAGLITAVSQGTTTISASLSGLTASTTSTVTAAALVSIAITPGGTTTIAAGKSQQFTATGTFTDNSTQNITSAVRWSSSDPSVTMSPNSPGLAVTTDQAVGRSITIGATQGTISAATPATLVVSAAALVSIAVTPANPSIADGTTQAFTATGTYTDNNTQDLTSSVTWSAATLSGGGAATFTGNSGPNVAKATAPGVVTITATSGSTSGNTQLTVTAPVLVSIVVTSTVPATPPVAGTPAAVTIYQGQTQQFYALGMYSDSSIQNITQTVAWSAGDGTIATVSNSSPQGLATAVAGGTVKIVATFTPATGAAVTSSNTGGDGNLTVTALNSVTITPTNPTAALGDANTANHYGATNNTLQFTATATYADKTTGTVTASATWTSGTQTVATIGGATGLATLLTAGPTTITATYAGVSGNTLLTVTPAILESITVAPAGVSLGLNGTQQFTATGSYSDGTMADLTQTATWASFNTQVVTVNNTGLATVVAATNVAVAVTASSGTIAPYGTNIAWVNALSTLPIVCPTPTIDMRLLVVNNAGANNNAGYADFPAIKQILDYVGTPYDVVDVSATPKLSDGACHGYYQGVIFAFSPDYYNSWETALNSYEQTFEVRQVNWYGTPDPNFGFGTQTGSVNSSSTYSANFTSAAAPIFFYANTGTPSAPAAVSFSGAFIYLAPPSNAMGTATPLITDSSGNALSVVITYADGRQYLTNTFDSNPYLTHDLVLAYGLLNWVTKGVFLGDYHVYATQQIDDFFIDDSEWIPSTTCLSNPLTLDRTPPDASNLPVFRVDAADMTHLVNWQTGIQNDTSGLFTQFKLTMAFNGVGTVGNGDWTGLTAPIISSSAGSGVATFTAQDFSGLPGQTVTVTNTTNGGNALNGTFTIVSVTSSAATTPGTTTFTVSIPGVPNLGPWAETATATAAVADDLVKNLQSYQGAFHWISHTYDHPSTLNGLAKGGPPDSNGDTIDLEVLTNLFVAGAPGGLNLDTNKSDTVTPLTLTDFNPANMVTPGLTGLNDTTGVPGYLNADGIQYVVSDTSVTGQPNNGPNPSPNVGIVNSYATGLYEVPRHPNDIFYNVANWADDQAEFVCIYTYYVAPTDPPGTLPHTAPPFNTYNAAQILDFTSSAFVTNMLMGDMDPEMFHQPDLHFADNYQALMANPFGPPDPPPVTLPGLTSPHVSSLISDTYDLTFSKYKALYNLPVLTPTLDQLGVLMQNRNSFNLSGVTASIVAAGTTNAQITITMPSSTSTSPAVIPVTGLTSTGSELYGGQNISHINMTPGQTILFPLP